MSRILLRSLSCLALVVCGSLSTSLYAGWFDSDNAIHVFEEQKAVSNAPTVQHAATIRVAGYVDERRNMAPKKIGISKQRISGISGKELLLNIDVTELVARSIKTHFDAAGLQAVEDASALYELSGVIKDLSYNVKEQDEVFISIETTLKELATGKVIWSGVVVEKPAGRFAGVSGNGKNDIARYLRDELGIVTQKTIEAISASLMASRPDLFNLTPGTKAIAGVTVHQAVGAESKEVAAPAVNSKVNAVSNNGTLVLSSKPTRAKVYVDGVYFGMSPLHAEVEVGIHEISVKSAGYKTAAEKVSVRKSEVTELELVLER